MDYLKIAPKLVSFSDNKPVFERNYFVFTNFSSPPLEGAGGGYPPPEGAGGGYRYLKPHFHLIFQTKQPQ